MIMVMIEITEDKFDDLYDNIESMLGFGSKAMSCLKKMKQERMGERMPDYRDDWRREREEREERENRRRFNNVNDDWNYPNRYGDEVGGVAHLLLEVTVLAGRSEGWVVVLTLVIQNMIVVESLRTA